MIWMDRWTLHAALHSACLLALLSLAFACPADDTVQSDVSGTGDGTVGVTSTNGITSTSSPGGSTDPTAAESTGMEPPLDACACVLSYPSRSSCGAEELVNWVVGCPQEQPCSRLSVTCPRPGQDLYDCTSELVFDEAAMQCMLETLRDGTPARLEIDGLLDYGISSGQSLHLVHVLEGRTAVRAACINVDVGAETFDPTSHVLTDADYFTACIEAATPLARYECMMDGLLGEGTTLPVCPD
jgi:hypothetical protein